MYERRIKSVRIHPEMVLAMFQDWKTSGYLQVFNVVGVPKDAQVVAVFAEQQPCAILMHVYHPTFEPVPVGETPPRLFDLDGINQVEAIKLERFAEEKGTSSFHVTGW